MRQMYQVDLANNPNVEVIVRKFLFSHSDKVELCRNSWTEVSFFKFIKKGKEDDPLFLKVKQRLQKYFIKKDDLKLKSGKIWDHYTYKLSPEIKKLLTKETLIWSVSPPQPENVYGFEDPAFLKKEELIGKVVNHESCVFLYLTPTEKKVLEKKGIVLMKCEH